ncbi:uncharacterized protein LOC132741106 [Ruditapes philippinarum]|uniref:uncharacterized protein LOC132741106 n=1 Tax=Ruditapes philippinarum TaxID=129788 RepID=UPI00295C1C2B|nr:uncharacterized protein LOC132741106 [Ruditapes philippinarum]
MDRSLFTRAILWTYDKDIQHVPGFLRKRISKILLTSQIFRSVIKLKLEPNTEIQKIGKRKSDDVGTGTGKVVKRDVERQAGNEELASDVKPLVFDVYVKQEGDSTFYCTLCNSHVARPVLPLHINGWKHNYLKQSKIKEEKENDVADKPLNTNVQGDIKEETKLVINKPIQTKVSAQRENTNKNIRKYSRYVLLQLRDNRASKCIPPGLNKEYFVDGVWSATEYKNRTSSKTRLTIANTSPKPNQANEEPDFNVDKNRKRPAEPCNGSSQEDSLQWKRRRYDEEESSTSQQRKSYYEGHKENKGSDDRHKTSSIRSFYTSRHYSSTRNHQSTRHYHYSRHQSTRHYDKNRTSYSDKPYSFHNFVPYNKLQHSWQPRTEPSSLSSLTKNDARSFGSSSATVNNETASKNKDVKASIDSKKGFAVREKSSAIGNFKDTEETADKKETQDKCTNSVQVLSTELECLAGGTANKVDGEQSAKKQSQGYSKKSAKELSEEDRTKYAKEISAVDDNNSTTELFCESTILNLKTPKESKDAYASFLKSIIPQQLNTSVAVDTDSRADDEVIVIESDKENDEKPGNKHKFCTDKAEQNDLSLSSLRREEHDAEITVKEEPVDEDVVDVKSQVAMNLSTNLENMSGRDKTANVLPHGNGPSSEKKSEKEIILKDFYNRCQNSSRDSRKRPAESCTEEEITRDSSKTIQGKSGALWKQNSQTKECVDYISKQNEGMNKKSQEPVDSNEKLPVTNVEALNEKEVAYTIFEDGAKLGKADKLPLTNVEAVSERIDERNNAIAISKDQPSDNEVAQEMNNNDGSSKDTEKERKSAKSTEKIQIIDNANEGQIINNVKERQIINNVKERKKLRSETGEEQTTDKTEMKGLSTNSTNERQIRNETMDGGKSANNSDENARGEDKPKTDTKTGQIDNTGKEVEATPETEEGQKPNNNMEEGQAANDKEETDKSTNNVNDTQTENNTLKTDVTSIIRKEDITADGKVQEQTANQTKGEQAINNTVERQTGNDIEEKDDLTKDTREEGNSTNITKEVQTKSNVVEEGQSVNNTMEEGKSSNGTKERQTAINTDDQGNSINSTVEKQTSDTTAEEHTTNNEVAVIDLEVPEASNVSVPFGNAQNDSNDNVVVIDLENNTEVVIIDLDKQDEEIFNGKRGGKLNNKRRGNIKKRFTDKGTIVIDNDENSEPKNSELKKLKKDVATLYCPVCKLHVDSDLWTGHMRGKRHRLNKQKRLESKHCKDLYKICIDQMRKQINRKKKEWRNKQKVKSSECGKECRKNKSTSYQESEIQDNSCNTHENAMQKRCSKQEGFRKTTVENIVKPDDNSVILIDSEHEEEAQTIGTLGQSHDTDSNVARQRSCCSIFSNNTNRSHCVGEGCNVQSSGTFRQEGLQIPDHSCQGIHYDCNFSAGFDGVIERIEFLHNKPCSIAVIIRVPEHDYPSVLPSINYSEMLVNPDCYNLKQIQWETGCYIELKYHQSEENESTVTSQRRRKRNPYILVKSYQHAEQAFACISVAIRKIKELMNTIKKGAGVTDPAHHPAYYYGYRRNKYGVKYR